MFDLAPIKARVAAATRGPWRSYRLNAQRLIGATPEKPGGYAPHLAHLWGTDADGELMANARTDIPALVAEVEAFRRFWAADRRADEWMAWWAEKHTPKECAEHVSGQGPVWDELREAKKAVDTLLEFGPAKTEPEEVTAHAVT